MRGEELVQKRAADFQKIVVQWPDPKLTQLVAALRSVRGPQACGGARALPRGRRCCCEGREGERSTRLPPAFAEVPLLLLLLRSLCTALQGDTLVLGSDEQLAYICSPLHYRLIAGEWHGAQGAGLGVPLTRCCARDAGCALVAGPPLRAVPSAPMQRLLACEVPAARASTPCPGPPLFAARCSGQVPAGDGPQAAAGLGGAVGDPRASCAAAARGRRTAQRRQAAAGCGAGGRAAAVLHGAGGCGGLALGGADCRPALLLADTSWPPTKHTLWACLPALLQLASYLKQQLPGSSSGGEGGEDEAQVQALLRLARMPLSELRQRAAAAMQPAPAASSAAGAAEAPAAAADPNEFEQLIAQLVEGGGAPVTYQLPPEAGGVTTTSYDECLRLLQAAVGDPAGLAEARAQVAGAAPALGALLQELVGDAELQAACELQESESVRSKQGRVAGWLAATPALLHRGMAAPCPDLQCGDNERSLRRRRRRLTTRCGTTCHPARSA